MYNILQELAIFSPFIISMHSFVSLIINNWKKDEAKLVLSYFMFVGSVFYAINIFKEFGNLAVYNYFHIVYVGSLMLGVPLIYIYICSLTLFRTNGKLFVLHFIPAFVLLYLGSVLFFQLDYNHRILFLENTVHQSYSSGPHFKMLFYFFNCFKFVFYAQLVFYYIQIRIILHKHQKAINHIFSDSSGFDLNWVKLFFRLLFVWGLLAILGYTFLINRFPEFDKLNLVFDIAVSLLFTSLYIMASMQKRLPYSINQIEFIESENNITNPDLKVKLLLCFEENKIYLKKDLTIWDVCRSINSNRTYVSNLINEDYKVNFNCFVNKYRVEHALKIIKNADYHHKSLEEIAGLSGFNSLASFNRACKKLAGCYPGSFRNN